MKTKILEALSRLLDQEPASLGVDRNWTDLGLDSLLLTQWSLKLQRDFNFPVSLKRLQTDLPNLAALYAAFTADSLVAAEDGFEEEDVAEENADFTDTAELDHASAGTSAQVMQKLMSEQIQLMNRQLEVMARILAAPHAPAQAIEPSQRSAAESPRSISQEAPNAKTPALSIKRKYHDDRGEREVSVPEHAFLGLDEAGQPAYFSEDPARPGQFLKYEPT